MSRHLERYLTCAPGEAARYERHDEVVCFSKVSAGVYNGGPQIQDITFRVYKGDFALIEGPTGSGKSTIHRTATMLETPVAGNVRLFGEDVHSYDELPYN